METKRDFEAKAKALISTNPDEAVKLYHELWVSYPDQFNSWDAFYAVKAMRAANSTNLTWANELAEKFKGDRVGNLYGWLIFDRCVKGKNRTEILSNEKFIEGLIDLAPQKSLKEDDAFPCPTTISILKLCDAHAENLFNAKRINELLSGLDYNILSNKSKTIETQERGEVELSSDLEKYFALKTKALLKLTEFHTCIEQCNKGLELLDKFHYNNDLWFKMRIALSEEGLGNHERSEELFKVLLESKAGNDKWFLYRDISEVYFEQGDFVKAWKYAVDAAFYGNEPHFLIGLFLLQARILFKLERPTEGKILAELISSILKEQEWNDKAEYIKLFTYYKIDRTTLPTVNVLIKEARKFWQNERYGNKPKHKGKIISIHKNGKIGRIKDQNNNLIEFHKKDLVKKNEDN
jgi:tetratricopeptide (TPR) repeat protein